MSIFIPIIFAEVVSFALGILWFSPLMFGHIWMKLSGVHEKVNTRSHQKKMKHSYFAHVLMSLFTIFAIYILIAIGFDLPAIFTLWFAFALPGYASASIWQGRSWRLFLIEAGYSLVSVAFSAEIIRMWFV